MRYRVETYKYVNGVRIAVCTPQASPKRQHIQRTVLNTRCYNKNAQRQRALRVAVKLTGRED